MSSSDFYNSIEMDIGNPTIKTEQSEEMNTYVEHRSTEPDEEHANGEQVSLPSANEREWDEELASALASESASWYRTALDQAANGLIEEVPAGCTCLVTVFYKENLSLMVGRTSFIQDGGLWEVCRNHQRRDRARLANGNMEASSSDIDDPVIQRFMADINAPPSLTVYVPVLLSEDVIFPEDLSSRPSHYGFDVVVIDGRVYYGADSELEQTS